MPNISVLHLVTSLDGGAGIAAGRLSQALLNQGVASSVLTLDSQSNPKNFTKISIQKRSLKLKLFSSAITFLQLHVFARKNLLVTPVSLSSGIVEKIDLSEFDILHVHSFYNLLSINDFLYLDSIGKPVVVTMHDQRLMTGGCHYSMGCTRFDNGCSKCPQVNKIGQFAVEKSMNTSASLKKLTNTSIVTPSFWLAKKAKESFLLSGLRTDIIRNPIPSIFFDLKPTPEKNGKTRIGFSSLDLNNPYKGIRTLINALNIIAESDYGNLIELVLIGKGEVFGLNPRVKVSKCMAATDGEMAHILAQLDAMIIPSIEDNSPSVLTESLAVGIRIIGSEVGGITELLDLFECSSFYAKDELQLASFIKQIISNPTENQVEKQKNLAIELFSFEVVATTLIELYESRIHE